MFHQSLSCILRNSHSAAALNIFIAARIDEHLNYSFGLHVVIPSFSLNCSECFFVDFTSFIPTSGLDRTNLDSSNLVAYKFMLKFALNTCLLWQAHGK